MQRFENQVVQREQCPVSLAPPEKIDFFRHAQNRTLQDLEFVKCEFVGEGLATYGRAVNRSAARDIRLKNCRVNSFFGIGAIFDDVSVDGLLTTRHPVILSACALRHVVIKGKCGRFLFNRQICHDDDRRNAEFIADNDELYRNLDWALDITDADFSAFEIRASIPPRLIRRNPDSHFIMSRAVALSNEWKNYEPSGAFQIGVSMFLESGADEELFVAARRSKHFEAELNFLRRLKSAELVA